MDSSLPPALQLLGGVLSMLQSSGVSDLSRVDMHGRSLLHYACALRHAGAVKLLLAARVDPRGVDVAGMSAADWARRTGFTEGEALIAQALANGDGVPPSAVAAVDSSMML